MVIPVIEQFATTFNGLGVWRGEQSVWGKRLQARTFDRGLYLLMHRLGFMGGPERKLLAKFVRTGMTVVDVGANVGLYTLAMADIAGPSGRVISFEPDPELFPILRANCAANGATNVVAVNAALGRAPDKMTLHRLALHSGDNHLGSKDPIEFRRPVEVDVAAFDGLYPGVRPDFVKVDVQGWELNVLLGMERTLSEANPVIFLEFWPDGLKRAGNKPDELFSFFRDHEYHLYSCDGHSEFEGSAFIAMASRIGARKFVNLIASRSRPNVPDRHN